LSLTDYEVYFLDLAISYLTEKYDFKLEYKFSEAYQTTYSTLALFKLIQQLKDDKTLFREWAYRFKVQMPPGLLDEKYRNALWCAFMYVKSEDFLPCLASI